MIRRNNNDSQLIYGTRSIIEAIEAGKELDKLYIQKGLSNDLNKELVNLAHRHKIPVSMVPVEKLNRLTKKNHQGAVAFISAVTFSDLDNIITTAYERGKDPLLLILDEVSDVRNFGAIARTAECAGVDAIVIPSKGSAAINSDAAKTSAGALHHIAICRVENLEQTIKNLKASGIRIFGLTEKTEKIVFGTDMSGPVAILMGSEESGIQSRHLRICDELVQIPMYGKISSLNVSVSAGIGIYEVVRQRQ